MATKSISENLKLNKNNWNNVKLAIEDKGVSTLNKTTTEYADLIRSIKAVLEEKNITPSTSLQVIVPDANVEGFNKIIVNAVTSEIDGNIVPENIKKDITILGVTGTLESGGSTEITNLAYFFYNNWRTPNEYWFVVNNKVTDMKYMLYNAIMDAGTYDLDISGITAEANLESVFFDTTTRGIVNIILKIGNTNTSLKKLMHGNNIKGNSSNYYNFSISNDSDCSLIESLYLTFCNKWYGTIDLTKLSSSPLKNLQETFTYMNVLNEIIGLSNLDVSQVTTLYRTFRYFNNNVGSTIETINLSSWDYSNVTNFCDMFNNAKVKIVEMNENININDVNLTGAFYGSTVTNINNLNIVESTYSTKTNRPLENTFNNCSNLLQITSKNKWIIHSGLYYTFAGSSKLVAIPEIEFHAHNINYKGTLEYTFKNCSSIENINISIIYDDNDGKYLYMTECFNNCTKLKTITGNLDLSNIYTLQNGFSGCTSLERIETNGQIAKNQPNDFTIDISASAVFDIASFINSLAANTSGYTRTIKLNSTVYSGITEETQALATQKSYTLVSA